MKKAGWLVLLGAAVAAVLVLKGREDRQPKGESVTSSAGTFQKTEEEGGIFTRPTGLKSAPALLIYGGVTKYSYATKAGMEAAMPASLKSRVFCLFVDYKSGEAASYLAALSRLASKYGLTFTDYKLMGFSGGASEVQRADWSKFSFVGLIDPYVSNTSLSEPFSAKVRMIYNPKNWGGSDAMLAVRALLPRVASAVSSSGGQATELSIKHEKMPAEFFSRYEQTLAQSAGLLAS